MSRTACCRPSCPAIVILDDALEARYRRTGETWYCPAGHAQYFTRKPDPRDAEIATLKRQLAKENREWAALASERWAVERQRDALRAAWLDDYLPEVEAGVHEAPDGTRLWLAPCGAHGRFLDTEPDHIAFLLNGHVKRCGCGPEIQVEVTA